MFGDEAMSRAQVFRWHKEFKNGREGVEDEPRSGRAVEVRIDNNVQRVQALVRQDRRLTIRMLSDELNINRETVRKILIEDLCKNGSKKSFRGTKTCANDCCTGLS